MRASIFHGFLFLQYYFAAGNTAEKHVDGPPLFLQNATSEQMRSFVAIVKNSNLTRAEKHKQVADWATEQGGEIEVSIFSVFLDVFT